MLRAGMRVGRPRPRFGGGAKSRPALQGASCPRTSAAEAGLPVCSFCGTSKLVPFPSLISSDGVPLWEAGCPSFRGFRKVGVDGAGGYGGFTRR